MSRIIQASDPASIALMRRQDQQDAVGWERIRAQRAAAAIQAQHTDQLGRNAYALAAQQGDIQAHRDYQQAQYAEALSRQHTNQQGQLAEQQAGFQWNRDIQHTDLQGQLNQTMLTQGEQMRMQRLKNGIADVKANPNFSDEEKNNLILQMQTGLDPLQQRMTQANILHQQVATHAAFQGAQQQATLFNQHQNWLAQGVQGALTTITDPTTGYSGLYYRNSRGEITPLDITQQQQRHEMFLTQGAVGVAGSLQGQQFAAQEQPGRMALQGLNIEHLRGMGPLQVQELRNRVESAPETTRLTQEHQSLVNSLSRLDLEQNPQKFYTDMTNLWDQINNRRQSFPTEQAFRVAQTKLADMQRTHVEAETRLLEGRLTQLGGLTPAQINNLNTGFERQTNDEIRRAETQLRNPAGITDHSRRTEANNFGLPHWVSESTKRWAGYVRAATTPEDTRNRLAELDQLLRRDQQDEIARRRLDHFRQMSLNDVGRVPGAAAEPGRNPAMGPPAPPPESGPFGAGRRNADGVYSYVPPDPNAPRETEGPRTGATSWPQPAQIPPQGLPAPARIAPQNQPAAFRNAVNRDVVQPPQPTWFQQLLDGLEAGQNPNTGGVRPRR